MTPIEFLETILSTLTEKSKDLKSDKAIISPLFQANLTLLEEPLIPVLQIWATEKLATAEEASKAVIARNLGNFGFLLGKFPLGNRAANLEIAIACYEMAFTVFTREAFPEDWAWTQNNLGNAYQNRLHGDRAANLEQAIEYYQRALQVFTREAFPENWAGTQNNLGLAYFEHLHGDRAANLEAAIECYQLALQVHSREAFPANWANTQANLGNAYLYRLHGDRAANLEQAIECCQRALQVYTREAFPEDWAKTQNNLGIAYRNRLHGDRAANLEAAIECYQLALQVHSREAFPANWANTQANLGNAYLYRLHGDRAANLEQAIECCQRALQVYTREAFPENWANTQNNLGNAYLNRLHGDRAANLEQAIECCQRALQVYTREAFPENWANTQNNLGNAYLNRLHGDRAANLELAIECNQLALQVRTREAFPEYHFQTKFNLGLAYQALKKWLNAHTAFADAIETLESFQRRIKSEEARRNIAEQWNKLYDHIVTVCLAMGDPYQAFEYVERSKTYNFNTFTMTSSQPFRLSYLQWRLDEQTALVEWYINQAEKVLQIFVVTKRDIVTGKTVEGEVTNLYFEAANYLNDYYDPSKDWQKELPNYLRRLTKWLHLDTLVANLQPTPEIQRLILVPHCYLHLFPIHALPLADGQCLLDKFTSVQYVPSSQLFVSLHQQARPDFDQLLAINNPTEDLTHAQAEVTAIQGHFSPPLTVLNGTTATKTNLRQALASNHCHCLHFAGHGYFDFNHPLISGLVLAHGRCSELPAAADPNRYRKISPHYYLDLEHYLTLTEVFTLPLKHCRLVTLSACETGLVDQKSGNDEYISLPAAFLAAGASNVISSLWKVDDISTALLMAKFYQNYFTDLTQPVALALNQAQHWLRTATQQELLKWALLTFTGDSLKLVNRELNDSNSSEIPYKKPYYWAGFNAIGLGQ